MQHILSMMQTVTILQTTEQVQLFRTLEERPIHNIATKSKPVIIQGNVQGFQHYQPNLVRQHYQELPHLHRQAMFGRVVFPALK